MPRSISEIRRAEIVQALSKALTDDGLSLPSNDAIAAKAGMSRQLIRHYFPDQQEMVTELTESLSSEYKQLLAKALGYVQSGDRLQFLLDFYFGQTDEKMFSKPDDDHIYDVLFAIANQVAVVRENLYQQYNLLKFTFAHEIQIKYADLSQKACEELAALIVSLMYGHWKMIKTVGFSDDLNIIAREAVDRLMQSYRENYQDRDASENTILPQTEPS